MLNSLNVLHTELHAPLPPSMYFRDISNTRRGHNAGCSRNGVSAKAGIQHAPSYHHLSAVGSPSLAPIAVSGEDYRSQEEQQPQQQPKAAFRFWYDERRFKGQADRSIVQQALYEAGGVRTGGYPKAAPVAGPLGSDRMDDWDMLWSPGRSALSAASNLRTGQLLPCIPGLASITKKAKLVPTLKAAYGSNAFSIIPESYTIPSERNQWGSMLAEDEEAREQLWILKTGQHLGKGLKLLPGVDALKAALTRRPAGARPYVVAQRYVRNPLLINGCKFGIRVWVLVSGIKPYRVYLHQNGLVLFSTQRYDNSSWEGGGGSVAEGHVTNYACNVNGAVWDLDMLKGHIGVEAFDRMWGDIVQNAAQTFSAALPSVQEESAKLYMRGNCMFEVLGLDYLIDDALKPWLLEVNATPSLAVEHSDPLVEAVIRKQKTGMVKDMVQLLDISNRFRVRYVKKGSTLSAEDRLWRYQMVHGRSPDGDFLPFVQQEMERRGDWLPLMPHFPYSSPDSQLRWGTEDVQLQRSMMQGAGAVPAGVA